MDDYLDSVDTVEEAKQLILQIIKIHKLGGFEIRGWMSNLLEKVPKELQSEGMVKLNNNEKSSMSEYLI